MRSVNEGFTVKMHPRGLNNYWVLLGKVNPRKSTYFLWSSFDKQYSSDKQFTEEEKPDIKQPRHSKTLLS